VKIQTPYILCLSSYYNWKNMKMEEIFAAYGTIVPNESAFDIIFV